MSIHRVQSAFVIQGEKCTVSAPDVSLLVPRRFAPLFVVRFPGASNDNLEALSVLGIGKLDYVTMSAMVLEPVPARAMAA